MRHLFVASFLSIVSVPAMAQSVAIAPQVIVIDSKTNSGAVTLVNQSNDPAEVSLSMEYGYPETDSTGTMFLQTFQAVDDTMPSAAPWVQIFPERLRLGPHGRRTVRILVSPSAQHPLAQREYWARFIVAARGAPHSGSVGTDSGAIQVGLSLEVRSVLPFFYRNGRLSTGVQIDSVRAVVRGDSLMVRAKLTRTGSAAFVGALTAILQDSHGVAVAKGVLPLGVYYSLTPRIPVSLHGVHPGNYTVLLTTAANRPDVPPELLLHAESVQTTFPVTIK